MDYSTMQYARPQGYPDRTQAHAVVPVDGEAFSHHDRMMNNHYATHCHMFAVTKDSAEPRGHYEGLNHGLIVLVGQDIRAHCVVGASST